VTQADHGVERMAPIGTQAAAGGSVGIAELTHTTIRERVSDYLDGSLDGSDRQRIEDHLDACRACSAYLATMRKTVSLLGQLPPGTAPPGVKAALLEQVRSEP
jgi:anti-sigma factor RsiW